MEKETFYLHQTQTEVKHLDRRIYKVSHIGCPDNWKPVAVAQHRVIASPGTSTVLQTLIDQDNWERDLQHHCPLSNIKTCYLEYRLLKKATHKILLKDEVIAVYSSAYTTYTLKPNPL